MGVKFVKSDIVAVIEEHVAAIDETLINNEKEKLLYIAMYKLKDEQRELLWLSKFQKMKYNDIAQIYETNSGAIKVKVHRALNKLKENYLQLEKI